MRSKDRDKTLFGAVCGLTLLAVVPVGVDYPSTRAQAQENATAKTEDLLKGKIEQHEHVRLARPSTPKLAVTHEAPTGVNRQRKPINAVLGEDDFMFNFKEETPAADNGSKKLVGEAENGEMVIAWENWHKRVFTAIFEKWKANNSLLGVAHVSMTFTKGRHVSVTVKDVDLPEDIYENMTQAERISMEELRQQFAQDVLDSVLPLDGNPVLDFPSKSQRDHVTLRTSFRGTTVSSYSWEHNDYERVPSK